MTATAAPAAPAVGRAAPTSAGRAAPQAPSLGLLTRREWRAHPWRYAVIVLALAMGVALAWSVHLINASALAEFSSAVRTTQGEPDASLRAPSGGVPDTLLDALASDPAVQHAMGVVALETYARVGSGKPNAVQVLGIDALLAPPLAPALLARVGGKAVTTADRNADTAADSTTNPMAMLDPTRVFLNAAARDALKVQDGDTLLLQSGAQWLPFTVSGDIAAGGGPLVVLDIAAAQSGFGFEGRLSRVDLRFTPGGSPPNVKVTLPAGAQWVTADDSTQRVSNLSRAYRVNLMVLALVALLVGAFMAYSVVALAVAQRTPTFALLGVLGLTAAERQRLVLRECAWLGAAGSVLGLLLGTGMAAWVLQRLGGDLGGGVFSGLAPPLQFQPVAAVGMGLLGIAAAVVGGWLPAREAQRLQPAHALKGLGSAAARRVRGWPAVALLALGSGLAMLPPVAGVPVAAYASVAVLLFGGVTLVPWVVEGLLRWMPTPRAALPLLAVRRAAFHRHTAMAVVAGIVASLALSVALTVMVASFRESVAQWLDQVLPADMYLRTAPSTAMADQAWLSADFEARVAQVAGVRRVEAGRMRALQLAPDRPTVALQARRLMQDGGPSSRLPMVSPALPAVPGEVGVYVSEAMVALYGATPGSNLTLPLTTLRGEAMVTVRVLGVWRDFARQFGSIVMDLDSYRRLTGDARVNDMSLWLQAGATPDAVQRDVRTLVGDAAAVDFVTTADLRSLSLTIFDRSFVVTRYLQMVAIAIGLVGIAAGLSAQVLARRKEFGLLSHLGLRRREVLRLVALESLAWLGASVLSGVALGLAMGYVLVHVVNPQSFHWTMDLVLPWPRIALLAVGVVASGVLTAWLSARMAVQGDVVRAVKEDW
jgi:putative ABC transport system permease protein